MKRWRALIFAAAAMTAASAPLPAKAQDMGQNGIAIPSWLFPAAQRRAREACENNQPECRSSVRAQIVYEKDLSLTVPWLVLGIAVIGVLLWLRVQERKKAQLRLQSRAKHDPATFRKLDKTPKKRTDNENDFDRLE